MTDAGAAYEAVDHPGWRPVGRIDFGRLDLIARIEGGAALLLFLSLQLPWYTRSSAVLSGSASAMIGGGFRWLIWVISLATAVYVFLGSVTSFRQPAWLATPGRRRQILVAAAAIDFLLVILAAFVSKAQPPAAAPIPSGTSVGTAIGAYLGLLLALAVLAASGSRFATLGATAPAPAAGRRRVAQAGPRAAAQRPGDTAAGPLPARPAEPPPMPPMRPAEPGSGPPTGWMPPQPPPPPPL
jgi:hypothetical protein